MEREEETVDAETDGTTGAGETEQSAGDGTQELDDGDADADAGEETEETEEGADKPPADAKPEWYTKRFGKLTAQRHAAAEAQAQAETERDAAKADAEQARAKYGDREILAAAKRTGALPEMLSAGEAETLNRADKLERDIDALETALDENPDGWTAGDRQVTAGQAKGWLRKARGELKEIADEAAQIRKAKADEVRELIRLGKEARARAKAAPAAKPGEKPAARPAVPKARPTAGAAQPKAADGVRRPVSAAAAKGAADLSTVKTRDDLVREFEKQYGG